MLYLLLLPIASAVAVTVLPF